MIWSFLTTLFYGAGAFAVLALAHASKLKFHEQAAVVMLAGFFVVDALFYTLVEQSSFFFPLIALAQAAAIAALLIPARTAHDRLFLAVLACMHAGAAGLTALAIDFGLSDGAWVRSDHSLVASVYNGSLCIEFGFAATMCVVYQRGKKFSASREP